ncbi:transporter substrate-binding domain-containing protein [Azospirillum sp. RWY-5-1]|uniref:Transporter substrate-binding domain-containing protein n=2 Tax=Azospirillum oleiclasticum TaxID=2735135 RepID=A0ABX2TEN3_9PROT|nr:transporter substrate-binding domain-containing protein [Azospirillum oleiclasticum]NYZ17677.1 transporter substrate-binding domain-containing protein [Azospirillum oleiclasticum]NYZ21155.1 transporter substrate-binding domain-containing protein [Azospirillum oleiclasticum]
MRARLFAIAALFLAAAGSIAATAPAAAQEKVVRLTSLDWPPFSGESQKDQGAAVAVVRAAFAAVGYRLEVSFFPWNRAVALVKADGGPDGYFPEYDGGEVRQGFHLSVPLGTSPLGFAERSAAPVAWASLDDLKAKRIGVVDGYVNTDELDARIADGRLQGETAPSDLLNLKKLAAGRIDLAVIDRAVMNDLLRTVPELKAAAPTLRFNPAVLEDKSLHIAFRKDARGEAMAKLFAEGLAKIDATLILQQALGS